MCLGATTVLLSLCLAVANGWSDDTSHTPPAPTKQSSTNSLPRAINDPASHKSKGIGTAETAAAAEISKHISTAEWLGPLAPIALSPFFGITCLAGMSQYGGDWIPGTNGLLNNPVLKSPVVLWTFLILTIITSLPRLTKISKPLGQAIDQLEAYAGIITLVVVRFAGDGPVDPEMATPVVQLGMFSFTADVLLAFAAGLNILVINGVKFFFEFLIWLTPIPAVDALFEFANKSLCAGMMALYAFSPFLASVLNLLLFAVCAVVFRWTHRRVVFYRTMLLDPLLAWVLPNFGNVNKPELVLFPKKAFGPIPAMGRCVLQWTGSGWRIAHRRLLGRDIVLEFSPEKGTPQIQRGWLTNTIDLRQESCVPLIFSRRFNGQWEVLLVQLNIVETSSSAGGEAANQTQRRVEFS